MSCSEPSEWHTKQSRVGIGSKLLACSSSCVALLFDSLARFCPASGLDSSTAYNLILLLKRLASDRGRTIVLTLHSPSSKMFRLFDRLILLTPYQGGGRVAFQGPANEALHHFESRLGISMESMCLSLNSGSGGAGAGAGGGAGQALAHLTVADYLMAILHNKKRLKELAGQAGGKATNGGSGAKDEQDEEEQKQQQEPLDGSARRLEAEAEQADQDRIDRIVRYYSAHPDRMPDGLVAASVAAAAAAAAGDAAGAGAGAGAGGGGDESLFALHAGSSSTLPWLQQFFHLSHRAYRTQMRDAVTLRARVGTNVFLALFVGLLYLVTDRSSAPKDNSNFNQASIFNRVGFIFFMVCMQALITLVNAVLTCKDQLHTGDGGRAHAQRRIGAIDHHSHALSLTCTSR